MQALQHFDKHSNISKKLPHTIMKQKLARMQQKNDIAHENLPSLHLLSALVFDTLAVSWPAFCLANFAFVGARRAMASERFGLWIQIVAANGTQISG